MSVGWNSDSGNATAKAWDDILDHKILFVGVISSICRITAVCPCAETMGKIWIKFRTKTVYRNGRRRTSPKSRNTLAYTKVRYPASRVYGYEE